VDQHVRRRDLEFGQHDLLLCWSCRWAYRSDFRPGLSTTGRKARESIDIYERCVEVIESYQGSGPFTRPKAWQQSRTGPTGYTLLGYALWDMRMHGLVDVVRWSHGRKASDWEVIGSNRSSNCAA
jgi:hypothetical protein